MSSSPEFAAHCVELLQPLGTARARRMFGGHGFYIDDLFVGIASGDRLFLKVDDQTRPRFEAAGCEAFDYDTHSGKRVALGFWTAPEEALESPVLMRPWAKLAMEAALRARNAKPAAKKATKPATKPAAKKAAPRKSPPSKTVSRAPAAKKKPAAPAKRKTAAPKPRAR